jgi:FG-GAP repeat
MRATSVTSLGLASLMLAGALGCDWRDVDKDKKTTPVLSIGPPSKFGPKDDFGRISIPIAAPSDSAGVLARFLVSGITDDGLGLIELNAAGEATGTTIASPVLSGNEGPGGFPLTAIAEIPGPKPGKVLAAAKSLEHGESAIYTIALGGTYAGTLFIKTTTTSDPYLGLGVAAANMTGTADPDYLIASPVALKIYTDGNANAPLIWPNATSGTTCPVELIYGDDPMKLPLNRPLVIGHFVPAGPPVQVAMSTFNATGKGSVSFFGVDAGGALVCLGTITGDEPQFGRSVTTGDFNGDLEADLLVGAPPNHAYIFLGPQLMTATPISLPADSQAFRFGDAVGAVKLISPGPDLALVGDPSAKIGTTVLAGNVSVFKLTAQTPTLDRTLMAHDVSTNASFGATIIAVPFCGMRCSGGATPEIPIIGAGTRVLAYFNLAGLTSDARKPSP